MKKTFENYIFITLCVAMFLFAVVFGILAIVTDDTSSTNYAMTCKVVDLDHENDLVILVDANGFKWVWEGIEDWRVGDCASLLMENNGTPKIFDDTILKINYNSWELN